MIRPHYGPQVGYTRMVGEAFEAWDQMWADLGRCHLSETGVLAVDLGDTVWMDATHKSLIETDTAFQRLDATSISKAAPVLSLPETAWGLLAPKADVLFADRILTDLAQWLRNAGAVLLENAQASSINESAAEVTLANGEAIYSDRLVVAAGAWSAELLPDLAEKIVPIRSVVTYVSPPAEQALHWAKSPALFLMTRKAHLYALPPVDGTNLKLGGAPILRKAEPRRPLRISTTDLQATLEAFTPFLSGSEGYQVLRGAGGYYADPADKRFIADVRGNTLVVTGCGGRMFKFGAIFGQRTAAWAVGDRTASSITAWAKG